VLVTRNIGNWKELAIPLVSAPSAERPASGSSLEGSRKKAHECKSEIRIPKHETKPNAPNTKFETTEPMRRWSLQKEKRF
jgi:hypothetical protein